MLVAAALASTMRAAVPQLKSSAESIPSAGIKARILAKSQCQPRITLAAQRWMLRRRDANGVKEWEEKHYDVREVWRDHEFAGEWRDSRGNALVIARVTSLCPMFEEEHAKREDIDAKIAENAEAFNQPDDAALAKWASRFMRNGAVAASAIGSFNAGTVNVPEARIADLGSGSHLAVFFRTKGGQWFWVEFRFAQAPRPREGETLIKTFLKSVASEAAAKSAASSTSSVGKTLAGYEFIRDPGMQKTQADRFVSRVGTFLSAMQAAYRRYVPPQRELGVSRIRLFASQGAYSNYLKGIDAAELSSSSIGIWSPSHEEMVILHLGKDGENFDKTLKTMRHEAFHQYLFYATSTAPGRSHALWFNEGHACFFENAVYDKGRNYIRVTDDPNDRRPAAVAKDPARYARHAKTILDYGRKRFYAGTLAEVNANYTAAWAMIYFLQKGAQTFKEFAAYRQVLPTYLKEMAAGRTWREATKAAWSLVEDRDFEADFLKFWSKRSAARYYEPGGK